MENQKTENLFKKKKLKIFVVLLASRLLFQIKVTDLYENYFSISFTYFESNTAARCTNRYTFL